MGNRAFRFLYFIPARAFDLRVEVHPDGPLLKDFLNLNKYIFLKK